MAEGMSVTGFYKGPSVWTSVYVCVCICVKGVLRVFVCVV